MAMLTYTRLHPVPMCWSYMAMLTYTRLHPVPMCWSYMAILTYKRLHPVQVWTYNSNTWVLGVDACK
jgi:hypothetical protein